MSLDELNLKGFNHSVPVVEVLGWPKEAEDVEVAAAVRRWKQPS